MPEYTTYAPSGILDAALQFLGAPYLWGGKSILGIDCSGLTQLTGQLCGVNIPRDASLQWSHASNKRPGFAELEEGDLVFFHKEGSDAVTHVGLAIHSLQNQWQIIHASGEVRIDDLTPQGIVREGLMTHLWTGASSWPVSAE
jgi:cell wall-associated NlpC family hydrolase